MQTEHMVITWESCGHFERDYILFSYSGDTFSYDIEEYVSVCYGMSHSPYWRIATPAERESKEFRPVTALSKPNQLTDQEKIDVLLGALSSLAKDVQMALDEELDTSDEWFACQLIIIDNAIKQTGLELPE